MSAYYQNTNLPPDPSVRPVKIRYALPSLRYLNPKMIILTTVVALMTVAVLALPTYQLWHAYSSGEGLDVSSSGYFTPAIIFLLIAGCAATLLRRLALALALKRQAAQNTIISEYRTDLSPVEAGVLIDAYSNKNEVAAVLLQLESKGCIRRETRDGQDYACYKSTDQELSRDETVFVQSLFARGDKVLMPLDMPQLVRASNDMRQAAYQRLIAQGYIPPLTKKGIYMYYLSRTFIYFGGFFNIILFFALFEPQAYIIEYPRYPVHLWQLGFIIALFLVLLLVPLQAYYSRVLSGEGMQKHREATSLYLYMKTVFKDRLTDNRLAKSELEYYLPYAYAFGLAEVPKAKFITDATQ